MLSFVNIWIAIPDSCISDEQTKRDKTAKISQFARACSIFRVKRIYIYHDKTQSSNRDDSVLLRTILEYLDTPQYLRRRIYPHTPELQYAGILPPIKSPHHKKYEDIKRIRVGDIRVGVTVNVRGNLHVDLGLSTLVPYRCSSVRVGQKVNVKINSPFPNLTITEATSDDIKNYYWGYEVKQVPNLHGLITQNVGAKVMITSKKGSYFKSIEKSLISCLKTINNLLVVFGSPKSEVEEILYSEGEVITRPGFIVNMFPFQGTENVRVEEAILGTLAVLNHTLSYN
jgi:methyltransferase